MSSPPWVVSGKSGHYCAHFLRNVRCGRLRRSCSSFIAFDATGSSIHFPPYKQSPETRLRSTQPASGAPFIYLLRKLLAVPIIEFLLRFRTFVGQPVSNLV